MLNVDVQKKRSHFTIDVQFQVNKEIVVLFGPSGSGKTTILHCIAGLLKPNRGAILLNGRMLYTPKRSLPIQHRKIGYLFQDYALFPHMNVWENVAFGMKRESLALHLMKELEIDHLYHQYPAEISGGEKQRVAIARALATEPELLLLDEPFSALDEATRKKGHDQLLKLHQLWKIPIILVTHNWQEAEKLGHRVLYIEKGRLRSS